MLLNSSHNKFYSDTYNCLSMFAQLYYFFLKIRTIKLVNIYISPKLKVIL